MTKRELKEQNAELAELLAAIRNQIDDKLEELAENDDEEDEDEDD
jgi:hypothetical protein